MEDKIRALEARIDGLTRDLAAMRLVPVIDSEIATAAHNMHMISLVETGGRRFTAAGFPVLARDEIVFFSDPDNAVFLGVGWWGTEPWGTWGRDRSELRFYAGEGYLGGYLEVRLGVQANMLQDGLSPSLRIVANGFFVGDFAMNGTHRSVRIRIPPAAIADGNILMVLEYSDPHRPPATGDIPDPRTLGIGLISLHLP